MEDLIRQEICATAKGLYDRSYAIGSSGNISARLPDGLIITPSDISFNALQASDLAKIDLEGNWISGSKPSKTLALHRAIYDGNKEVNGIVHTHSTNLVLLTLIGVWSEDAILPPITPYQVMKVGKIPLINYHRPGSPLIIGKARELASKTKGLMLERLGPVIWGQSVTKAGEILEELEETARLWNLSTIKPSPMSQLAIADLNEKFNCTW